MLATHALVLALVAALNGGGSAALAVSSFTTLLPILTAVSGLHPVSALLVCVVVDSVNGLLVFTAYRSRLPAAAVAPVAQSGAVAAVCAGVVAWAFGVQFVREHESIYKHGSGVASLVFAAAFLARAYRHRGSVALEDEPEAAEGDAHEVATEGGDSDFESAYHRLDGGEELKARVCPAPRCSAAGARRGATLAHQALLGALSGLVGFGGGPVFASMFIVLFRWSTLVATCAGGLVSGLMTGALALVYATSDSADRAQALTHLLVCLPPNCVALLAASRVTTRLNESQLCLFVAGCFLLTGVVAIAHG